MPDLLVEVGCEELPSSACREIIAQAPELLTTSFEALGLDAPARVELSVAPRRFALLASGVPEGVAATSRRVRGPSAEAAFDAEGAPTRAAEGFARGQGVAVDELVVDEADGRRFVFAERREEGRPVEELVPDVVARVVGGLRFSKTMRWGDGTGLRFSRPVRWIVAKLDERDVPFELHGLVAGGRSQGHRFLGAPVEIRNAASYHEALESVAVIAGHERRRARIVSDLDAAAAEAGAAWRDPGGKLDEVVFLVEWPSVVTGRFDPRHLALPSRVLVTAMQSHQRYFPLEGADGALRPAFLAVSNGDPAHAAVIARGYEDVLDARLQDAEFSFERDREAGLEALDARLGSIVFHARLGSMADKRDRLVAGVADIAAAVGAGAGVARTAAEAARLAKVDQGAVLVAEFSELEGYAAAVYARLEGVDEAVAAAVEEQYLPEGPDSPPPATEAGAMLAAAEKVDNLIGAFAVGEAPTGSKDPYGLRRAAAGLVRIALERDWDVDPCDLLRPAYGRLAAQGAGLTVPEDEAVDGVVEFLGDRLAYLLAEEGIGPEAAAAALGAGLGGAPSAAAWARALEAARDGEAFGQAWTAATRLTRIARKAPADAVPPAPGDDPGEAALREAVEAARPAIESARAARDPAAALAAAAGLAPAVDRFFTDVLVNADDPGVRARRYALVREAAELLGRVADFERVTEGGGSR
ncbi:MAG TPA: glycine--tRNA ligase subunit beta [Miltoncostaeaceae bacterium]|nr:glycine--tRNA ligase subunit beta [Miltoncostaeaceae bacterium]